MPSIFTLEGPRLIADRSGPKPTLVEYGGRLGAIAVPGARRSPYNGHSASLMGAVETGFGELSSGTKTVLVIAGVIGLVAIVARGGFRRAGKRGLRGLHGLRAEHVRINRGGYDSGGRYWGTGEKLYNVYDTDGDFYEHVRASSAAEAKRKLASKAAQHRAREDRR